MVRSGSIVSPSTGEEEEECFGTLYSKTQSTAGGGAVQVRLIKAADGRFATMRPLMVAATRVKLPQ